MTREGNLQYLRLAVADPLLSRLAVANPVVWQWRTPSFYVWQWRTPSINVSQWLTPSFGSGGPLHLRLTVANPRRLAVADPHH